MALQTPFIKSLGSKPATFQKVYCYKCGAEVRFRKDVIAPSGKKVPLDPFFNMQPHIQYCMYEERHGASPDLELLLIDFLSMLPRQKKVLFAVGKAKE